MAIKTEAGSASTLLDEEQARREWSERVENLCGQVRAWSEEQGWKVTESQVELTEEEFGAYTLPMLTIEMPNGKLLLKPIGRRVYKGEGRVDLTAYPTWDEVRLMAVHGEWIPRIALGLTWPIPWGRECFLDLAQRLVSEP